MNGFQTFQQKPGERTSSGGVFVHVCVFVFWLISTGILWIKTTRWIFFFFRKRTETLAPSIFPYLTLKVLLRGFYVLDRWEERGGLFQGHDWWLLFFGDIPAVSWCNRSGKKGVVSCWHRKSRGSDASAISLDTLFISDSRKSCWFIPTRYRLYGFLRSAAVALLTVGQLLLNLMIRFNAFEVEITITVILINKCKMVKAVWCLAGIIEYDSIIPARYERRLGLVTCLTPSPEKCLHEFC